MREAPWCGPPPPCTARAGGRSQAAWPGPRRPVRSSRAARRAWAALWRRRTTCLPRRPQPCRVLPLPPPPLTWLARFRVTTPGGRGGSRLLPTRPRPPRRVTVASQLRERRVGLASLVQHRHHTPQLTQRGRVLLRLVELCRDGERRGHLPRYRRDDR